MKNQKFCYGSAVLAILWTAVIFANSLKTGVQSSGMSEEISSGISAFFESFSFIADWDTLNLIIRKLAHIAEFSLLSLLISLGFWFAGKRLASKLPLILLMSVFVAIFDELIQSYVPGRSSEVKDVLIDFCGCAVGAGLALLAQWIAEKRKEKDKTV